MEYVFYINLYLFRKEKIFKYVFYNIALKTNFMYIVHVLYAHILYTNCNGQRLYNTYDKFFFSNASSFPGTHNTTLFFYYFYGPLATKKKKKKKIHSIYINNR